MGMPENRPLEFIQAVPGTVDTGTVQLDVRQWSDKGFDYIGGAGKGWTGTLEGSVSGRNWDTIDALTASGQGSIGAHFNLVRLSVTAGGALGTGTEITISGKVI